MIIIKLITRKRPRPIILILELGALFKNAFQQLKEKTEEAENWKSGTIDIRKLVFYIDILNEMADNDNKKHR